MACRVCGSAMYPLVTDLPSERDKHGVVIGRDLPVLHCANCGEHLLDDGAMARIEQLLDTIDPSVEFEIVRYAA